MYDYKVKTIAVLSRGFAVMRVLQEMRAASPRLPLGMAAPTTAPRG
jgi:hypothetical protein